MLDRMSLSVKNAAGWMSQGRVYIIFTAEEIMEALCRADNKASGWGCCGNWKKSCGLDRAEERRGLGRPSLIYVKNFI